MLPKRVQEKVDHLDPWFDLLKNDEQYTIHDVIELNGEVYVIWSDIKGYSVSHKAFDGKSSGVSGIYQSIHRCYMYIPNFE